LDWLRKLKDPQTAKRDPPPIPMNTAAKLADFGLARTNGPGAFAITSKGRDALLDQDMRDAEDRCQGARMPATTICPWRSRIPRGFLARRGVDTELRATEARAFLH